MIFTNWITKFYIEAYQEDKLTLIEREFLLEAFSSLDDLEEYMKENHYEFLISGKKLRLKDVVEYLLK